jgi:hypothetical protein
MGLVRSEGSKAPKHETAAAASVHAARLVRVLSGDVKPLERPPVEFDHDLHTRALNQKKESDCKVCHMLQRKERSGKSVKVFIFPKVSYDMKDRDSVMEAYHNACASCHKERAAKGRKAGPPAGQCGKCHVRRPKIIEASWNWSPIFNYARHAAHVKALTGKKFTGVKVDATVLKESAVKEDRSTCGKCHHVLDKKTGKLIYKTDCENSCAACHKTTDGKTGRALRKVVHAECLACHIKMKEAQGGNSAAGKTKVGPITCKGCHGEHKTLSPDEIGRIPRLVRGQKDVMDIVTADSKAARMKVVVFNHKFHEGRTQFCNSCHHHSLEKCSNCHTLSGDKKGGGISFERAFHEAGAKQSCAGCHERTKRTVKCAGCHQWITGPLPKRSCPVCHSGPTNGQPVEGPLLPITFDKDKIPEKPVIKSLAREFKPVELPHWKIIKKLTEISNKSTLARAFHGAANRNTLCEGCHHHMDLSAAKKEPKCNSCHGRRFMPDDLGRPGTLAAYHRQCMGCHKAMHEKPRPLECVKCHPAQKGTATAKLSPVRGFEK